MKSKSTLRVVATALWMVQLAMAAPLAHAGSEGSGGGHGVVSDGRLTLLDLVDEPARAVVERIDLFKHSSTQVAAAEAIQRIRILESRYPEFARAFVSTIREMSWYLSNVPLAPVYDADIGVPTGLVPPQIAVQDGRGNVVIDQSLYARMSGQSPAALFVHEGFLGKLGLNVPRKAVRRSVKALFNDQISDASKIAEVEAALDPISKSILAGTHSVVVRTSNHMPYIADFWIGSDDWRLDVAAQVKMNHEAIDAHKKTWSVFKKTYAPGQLDRDGMIRAVLFGMPKKYLSSHFPETSMPYQVVINGIVRAQGSLKTPAKKAKTLELPWMFK